MVSNETGLAILRLLSGAQVWSAERFPQYVTAWGTHPYLPGSAAALEVSAAGKKAHFTFRSGCSLFDIDGELWVVPSENRGSLVTLFKSLSDKDCVKFWR